MAKGRKKGKKRQDATSASEAVGGSAKAAKQRARVEARLVKAESAVSKRRRQLEAAEAELDSLRAAVAALSFSPAEDADEPAAAIAAGADGTTDASERGTDGPSHLPSDDATATGAATDAGAASAPPPIDPRTDADTATIETTRPGAAAAS